VVAAWLSDPAGRPRTGFHPDHRYADAAIVVALVLRSVVGRAGAEALERQWPGSPEGLAAIVRLAGNEPKCRSGSPHGGSNRHVGVVRRYVRVGGSGLMTPLDHAAYVESGLLPDVRTVVAVARVGRGAPTGDRRAAVGDVPEAVHDRRMRSPTMRACWPLSAGVEAWDAPCARMIGTLR
jgi:hypothetical protein